VHREVGGDVLLVDLGRPAPPDDPGVVDEDVDAAEPLDRRLDQGARPLGAGDVGGVVDRRGAVGLDVVDDDARAAGGQQVGIRAPEAAGCAGDDGDPSVEPELVQAGTGVTPRIPPKVPPTMAARSSSGTPANCVAKSSRLPRKVPSACG
jgi:hypothetical protein